MPGPAPSDSGPPAAGAIRLAHFEQATALFARWEGQFEQISGGRFEGTLRFARGGRIRVVGVESNQRVRLRGHDTAGLLSVYLVTEGNAGGMWQGRRLAPGRLVVTGPDAEVDHYSARRNGNLGVSVRPEALEEAARALSGTDRVALPRTWATLAPPPEAFAGLSRRLSGLLNRGVADPPLLGRPDGRGLEQECVRSLVASLFPATAQRPDPPLPARARVLRRAEEFMRSRLADPVGAIDLCRELGVSDRTLRLAFRERYGLGPMAYYKCLRLNAVRSRLRGVPPVAVAAAARAFGFHHHGNFAADYRRLFGDRPVTTPGRAADAPAPGDAPTT